MGRFTIAICIGWLSMAGIVVAQAPTGLPRERGEVASGQDRSGAGAQVCRTLASAPAGRFARRGPYDPRGPAHEQHLLQRSPRRSRSIARPLPVPRNACGGWNRSGGSAFQLRPTASVDPVDGDYSPGWVSNYPVYPFRWVGSGEPWGFVNGQ